MIVHYDADLGATYVELSDAPAARSTEVLDAYVLVNLDGAGAPVGVEVLDAPASITEAVFSALAEHFPALDLDRLRAVLAGRALARA
ncbi:MAG: DUF2283 domain-containing protein [Acidimicrobiales bacterium]